MGECMTYIRCDCCGKRLYYKSYAEEELIRKLSEEWHFEAEDGKAVELCSDCYAMCERTADGYVKVRR